MGSQFTGKTPVIRRFPMIAGIDLAGTAESSSHPQWKRGDRVVLSGWGLGETHFGGYAEKQGSKGIGWLVCPHAIACAALWPSAQQASPRCLQSWPSNTRASRRNRGQ